MRNTNKKGFTIVELVVVVAVIAILAAVLIPTVSGIIKKANVANDTVVAKNMNTALAEYTAENGEPESFTEVLKAIENYGFVISSLNAKANGNLYAWDKENNQIVYLDSEFKAIYQNVDFKFEDLCFVVADSSVQLPAGSESVALTADPDYLKDSFADGGEVAIADDIKITDGSASAKNIINSNTTVNFGNNVVKLELEGNPSNYNALRIENGTVVLNGNDGGLVTSNNPELYALTVNAAATGDEAKVTIKGGKYIGGTTAINAVKGSVIIEGGYFEVQVENTKYLINANDTQWKAGACDIQIKGGTFVNFDPSANCEPANPEGRTNYLADGYKVVSETQENGDVWYTVVAAE